MAPFEMCAACRAEYDDPADRRFHAQPIACPRLRPDAAAAPARARPDRTGDDALRAARALLADGAIVAVKGLGGYHLACDATRRDGGRGAAPAQAARRQAVRGDGSRPRRRPAVAAISPRRGGGAHRRPPADPAGAAAGRHRASRPRWRPATRTSGCCCPTRRCTSCCWPTTRDEPGSAGTPGDDLGQPVRRADRHRRRRGAGPAGRAGRRLADATTGRSGCRATTRSARSVARRRAADPPGPRLRAAAGRAALRRAPSLAAGADLKNTCASPTGGYAWLSQHIGDMDDLATLDALTATADHLELLTGVAPAALVADRTPGVPLRRLGAPPAAGRPVRTVQHHHAHVASVMGEHGLGRGPHGDRRRLRRHRLRHRRRGLGRRGAARRLQGVPAGRAPGYVPLAGGDASVAAALPDGAGPPARRRRRVDARPAPVAACPPNERGCCARQLDTGFGCVPTSSMGRLFDAVAALAGVRQVVDYEAEAAIELEGLARGVEADEPYPFGLGPPAASVVARPGPGDPRGGRRPARRASPTAGRRPVPRRRRRAWSWTWPAGPRRHRARDRRARRRGVPERAAARRGRWPGWTAQGFTVLRPRLLPPNDGGIALGQVLVAAAVQVRTNEGGRDVSGGTGTSPGHR